MNQAMIPTIIVVLVIYFAAMVFIGWLGRSKASNFEGYLSMGRSAGVLLLMGGAIGGQIGNGFVVGGHCRRLRIRSCRLCLWYCMRPVYRNG